MQKHRSMDRRDFQRRDFQRRDFQRRDFQRGQWSLIGLLVGLAIVMILSAWYYTKILKPKPGSANNRPAAEQAASGAVCSVYSSQMNQASMLYKQDHDGRPPQSFEDIKKAGGVTDEMLYSPGCQFQLDPSSGAVIDIGHGLAAKNAPLIVLGGGGGANGAAPGGPVRGPGGIVLPPASGMVPPDGGDGTQ